MHFFQPENLWIRRRSSSRCPWTPPGGPVRRARYLDGFERDRRTPRPVPLPVRRAVLDEMRSRPRLFDAVVAAGMAFLAALVTIEEMTEYLARHGGWAGVPLARKALALADAKALVIEYDGADYLPERRRSKDVDREGAFRDVGLEVVHVVALDMRHQKKLAERLTKARRRARFEPEDRRRWTLEPTRPRYCPECCSCRARRPSGQ